MTSRPALLVTLLVFLLLCSGRSFAQQDSLRAVYYDTDLTWSARTEALEQLVRDEFLFTRPDSAAKYGELLIAHLKDSRMDNDSSTSPTPLQLIKALNETALAHIYLGHYDVSLEYLSEALERAEEAGEKREQIKALQRFGYIYHKRDLRDKEGKSIRDGLALSQELKDTMLIAAHYINLGVHLKSKGLHAEALDSYYKSLKIYESLGDEARMADVMNNLANIHRDQGNYSQSLSIHQHAFEIRKGAEDDRLVNISLNNLGVLNVLVADSARSEKNEALAESHYSTALGYLEEALALASSRSDIEEEATAQLWLGIIAERRGNHAQATGLIETGLKAKRELGNRSGISYALNALGQIDLALAEDSESGSSSLHYKMALNRFEEAYDLSTQGKASSGLLDALGGLYEVHDALGHDKEALHYLKGYHHLNDSIMSQQNQRALFAQQYRYEYETQAFKDSVVSAEQRAQLVAQYAVDRRNLALVAGLIVAALAIAYFLFRGRMKRKALIKEAEASELKLQSAMSEMKALRAQMNPHFIFNALQSIQTFLIRNNTMQANEYLLKFSKLMRAVLENSVHDEVPIKSDCDTLRLYMELESIRLEYPFTYSIDIDDDIRPEEDCIPPLILQPFVENAIWHGLHNKGAAGHIRVHICRDGDNILCSVEDNGIGRKASRSRKVVSTRVKKESLGMKITQDRLRVRDERTGTRSDIEIVDLTNANGIPSGTLIRLSIPLAA